MRAELAVAARPELVRTARLTAGQAARRAGVADDVVVVDLLWASSASGR